MMLFKHILITSFAVLADAALLFKGHDLSSLVVSEQSGTVYKDTSQGNATRPAEDILIDGGMNTARLRLWTAGQYDLAYTLALAQRFHSAGLQIYLDFHFSDTWADPGHQAIPAGWPTTLTPLAAQLRSYVSSTIESFHNAGVPLAFVSLGNEIHNGMLWPVGEVTVGTTSSFSGLATLLLAARAGVNDAVAAGATKPAVMIHIDNGWDTATQVSWFQSVVAEGFTAANWDVFAWSFYPFYGTSATLSNLANTLKTMAAAYNKPMHVVETDWPVGNTCGSTVLSDTAIPQTVAGQTTWVQDIASTLEAAPSGLGQGLFYWEPTWLQNEGLGSPCEDNLLFSGVFSGSKSTGFSRASVDMFS